ncbi:MAG: tol-pal system-associated acyl-CoA thioesterase [Pseudomonadota bacterium]|nr:tol-pal system-associated acyl-CoA thioesterase [Pseudomonadota bacterium]
MQAFQWPLRVYYEDTDAAGVVYYANYLKFMERARTEWLRQLGFEQTHLRQQEHVVFVVRTIAVDYLKPALLNDLLSITSELNQLGKAKMSLTQAVLRQADPLCTATVKVGAVDIQTLKPRPFPLKLYQALVNMAP